MNIILGIMKSIILFYPSQGPTTYQVFQSLSLYFLRAHLLLRNQGQNQEVQ